MNRRIFLKGAGGAALAAPFLTSVREPSAKAQDASPPKRSVIYHTHNGCLTNRWFPTVNSGTLTDAALMGTTLEILSPYKDKLLFPRGLRMYNSYLDIQGVDPHDQAMGSKLTCRTIEETGSRYASGRSMDHEIAEQVNPGGESPLVLSVAGGAGSNIKDVLSFSAPFEAFPAQTNPQAVYNSLTNALSTSGGPMTEADYRILRGESIIDLVKGDLGSYKRLNMSQSDQKRVDDWLALLRETEVKDVVATAACTTASAESLQIADFISEAGTDFGGGSSVFGGGTASEAAFEFGASAMFRLMALTMMCDANRSFIFTYPGYAVFEFLDHAHDHHGLSHRNGSFDVGGTCVNGVLEMIHEIDIFFAKKYAELVGLLNEINEGDVKMLDNCAVTWMPELADGNAHNTNNLPIVIAGSLGGYLKQGQVIDLEGNIDTGNSEASCSDGNTAVGFNTSSRKGNVPHNKLLLTLMNGCGCTDASGNAMTEWGEFDSSNLAAGITKPGELTELRA